MKSSVKKGVGFGLTSGIITTLGLIVGLHSGTNSKMIILAGILVIAIADAFSDALGIHIAEEAGSRSIRTKHVWKSTCFTFLSKLIFALTFIIPIWFLELQTAIIVSVIWGLFLLAVFSFYISKQKRINPLKPILEHLAIAVMVIVITHFIGHWISGFI